MNHLSAMEPMDLQRRQAIIQLQQCSDILARYGLHLNDVEIDMIVEKRFEALRNTGRIEFGEGVIHKLLVAFCDSPYISQDNLLDTVLELQDSFYYFKNESLDRIDDEELISFMRRYFDNTCQGSLDYLNGTLLEDLCRRERYGFSLEDGRQF